MKLNSGLTSCNIVNTVVQNCGSGFDVRSVADLFK